MCLVIQQLANRMHIALKIMFDMLKSNKFLSTSTSVPFHLAINFLEPGRYGQKNMNETLSGDLIFFRFASLDHSENGGTWYLSKGNLKNQPHIHLISWVLGTSLWLKTWSFQSPKLFLEVRIGAIYPWHGSVWFLLGFWEASSCIKVPGGEWEQERKVCRAWRCGGWWWVYMLGRQIICQRSRYFLKELV